MGYLCLNKPLCFHGCRSWWLWIIIIFPGALLVTIIAMLLQWLRVHCVTAFAAKDVIFRNILLKGLQPLFSMTPCLFANSSATCASIYPRYTWLRDFTAAFGYMRSSHIRRAIVMTSLFEMPCRWLACNKIPGERACQALCPSKNHTWQMCAVWVSVPSPNGITLCGVGVATFELKIMQWSQSLTCLSYITR